MPAKPPGTAGLKYGWDYEYACFLDVDGRSGRCGIYLLHIEKLKMRSELRLYREHEGLAETEGFTQITAWRNSGERLVSV